MTSGLCATLGIPLNMRVIGISVGGFVTLRSIMYLIIVRFALSYHHLRPPRTFAGQNPPEILHRVLKSPLTLVISVVRFSVHTNSCNYICLVSITGYILQIYLHTRHIVAYVLHNFTRELASLNISSTRGRGFSVFVLSAALGRVSLISMHAN